MRCTLPHVTTGELLAIRFNRLNHSITSQPARVYPKKQNVLKVWHFDETPWLKIAELLGFTVKNISIDRVLVTLATADGYEAVISLVRDDQVMFETLVAVVSRIQHERKGLIVKRV